MTERRQVRRYSLALPAVINPNAATAEQKGRTRDLSTRGVFLILRHRVKNDFDVMIEFPTETGVYVQAVARTVRTDEWTEQGKPVVGVGAVIERHEIVRSTPGRSGSSWPRSL